MAVAISWGLSSGLVVMPYEESYLRFLSWNVTITPVWPLLVWVGQFTLHITWFPDYPSTGFVQKLKTGSLGYTDLPLLPCASLLCAQQREIIRIRYSTQTGTAFDLSRRAWFRNPQLHTTQPVYRRQTFIPLSFAFLYCCSSFWEKTRTLIFRLVRHANPIFRNFSTKQRGLLSVKCIDFRKNYVVLNCIPLCFYSYDLRLSQIHFLNPKSLILITKVGLHALFILTFLRIDVPKIWQNVHI